MEKLVLMTFNAIVFGFVLAALVVMSSTGKGRRDLPGAAFALIAISTLGVVFITFFN